MIQQPNKSTQIEEKVVSDELGSLKDEQALWLVAKEDQGRFRLRWVVYFDQKTRKSI